MNDQTGAALQDERDRLGRWPTVGEAIEFVVARGEDPAILRALGKDAFSLPVFTTSLGRIGRAQRIKVYPAVTAATEPWQQAPSIGKSMVVVRLWST